MLDQALGFLQHHFGDLHVPRRRLIEGGGDNLALHGTGHVGDFFRPLIDQQHDQEDFRVIGADGGGDVLQHHRLTRPGRSHDQRPLALADRRNQIDHPRCVVLLRAFGDRLDVVVLHFQPLVRVQRSQVIEIDAVFDRVRMFLIDGVDLEQGEITLPIAGGANLPFDRIAGAQRETAHLGGADVNVIGTGQIVRLGITEVAEAVGQDFQSAVAIDRLVLFGQRFEDGKHHVLLAQGRCVFDTD